MKTEKQKKSWHLSRRELLKYSIYGSLLAKSAPGLLMDASAGMQKKANVVMISMDTTRRDHCSVYGYHHDTTPNLRKVAKQGAMFDMAFSPTSTTSPTHASIFTSLYPITHRLIKNGLVLDQKYETLAEILSKNGYECAGVIGSFVLNSKFGFGQGFKHYDDNLIDEEANSNKKNFAGLEVDGAFDRTAQYTTAHAKKWLTNIRDAKHPFFLFVHYFDPHQPYYPPKAFKSMFPIKKNAPKLENRISKYDGEIAFTDHEIGNLFDTLINLDLEKDTIIIVTADHGEGLMQHGHMFHGIHLYDEAVRVPLIFRWPGHIPEGIRFEEPVELIDLAPTILDMVGIKAKNWNPHGRSLADVLLGRGHLDPDRPVFLHRRHYNGEVISNELIKGEKFGVRLKHFKYIEGKEEKIKELFDLETDPQEKINIFKSHTRKVVELASMLEEWKRKYLKVKSQELPSISKEDIKRLESLGYIQ